MSNDAEIEEQIARKVSFYAASVWRKPVAEATARVYARALADYGEDVVSAAMAELVMKQTFFPSVAEIRQTARNVVLVATGKEEKEWDEVWDEVIKSARQSAKCPFFSDSMTSEAVKLFGWNRLLAMESNDYEVCRAHFRDIYNNIKTRRRKVADNRAVLRLLGPEAAERIKALAPPIQTPAALSSAEKQNEGGTKGAAPPPKGRLAELYAKLNKTGGSWP